MPTEPLPIVILALAGSTTREPGRFGFHMLWNRPWRKPDTTRRGMPDINQNAQHHLADDTRFRPLNELHERYYYTDPQTGQSRWVTLREALAMKAALDKAAMHEADAEAGKKV
jgi:hypothetical protein